MSDDIEARIARLLDRLEDPYCTSEEEIERIETKLKVLRTQQEKQS